MGTKKSRKKKKRSKGGESSFDIPPIFMDRRAMEKAIWDISKLIDEREFSSPEEVDAFLQQIIASGGLPSASKRTPLEEAQDLMYQAWNSSGRRRVELALKALNISQDCADAYVLLAEEVAETLEEARELYEQGVRAGERALGPKMFKEEVGNFWGIIETRPYMRARAGLAQCLWLLGERRKAIEHYTDMLRLNPNDNQGIRYILANCLLEESRDKDLGGLLDQYDEDSAAWLYTRALWAFRQEGAGPKASASLKRALKQNRFVPLYLLGRKNLPHQLPPFYGIGDENEAIVYAAEAIEAWRKTPEALKWLSANLHGKAR